MCLTTSTSSSGHIFSQTIVGHVRQYEAMIKAVESLLKKGANDALISRTLFDGIVALEEIAEAIKKWYDIISNSLPGLIPVYK